MPDLAIRIIGDPVLQQRAAEVTEIDGQLVRLCQGMLDLMYAAPGIGLAAPQVGVPRRLFVYDLGDGPAVLVNPVIAESDGEWEYEEGCLSIPGLYFPILRPKQVHLKGFDLNGREVSFEADELTARLFQHELDHLDGVLMTEHMTEDQLAELRRELAGRTDVAVPGAARPDDAPAG